MIKLFKNYYKSRNTRLSYYNIVFYLKKESSLHHQWAMDYMEFLHDDTYRSTIPIMKENSPIPPLPTPPTFITLFDLTPEHRIMSLYFLIELQMDIKDWKYLNNTPEEIAANGWRVLPVGFDRWGCTYWLFDDSRLFREAKQEIVDQYSQTTVQNLDTNKSDHSGNLIVKTEVGHHTSNHIKKDPVHNGELYENGKSNQLSTSSSLESLGSITDPVKGAEKPQIKLKLKLTRPTLKPPSCTWQLVCKSKSEWTNFPLLFSSNSNSGHFACDDEKVFYEYLSGVIPLVIADIEANEEEKKKRKKHERDWDVAVPPPTLSSQIMMEQQYQEDPSPSTLSEQFQMIEQSVLTKRTDIGATRNSRKRQFE